MRTSVILPILLLTFSTACAPERVQPDGRPDFDDTDTTEGDTDTTEGDAEETGDAGMGGVDPLPDMTTPETTESALCCFCSNMQCFEWAAGELACEQLGGTQGGALNGETTAWCELDVFGGITQCVAACESVIDNDPCCFCLGGTLPECLPLNAEECAAYEAANGLESCDPTFDDCQCDVEPLPDMPAPDLLEGCCVCVDGLPVCEIWPSSPPLPACIGIFSSPCEFIDGELLCEVSCT